MSDTSWPKPSWEPSSQRVAWLTEHTRMLASRARAFEKALEEAGAEGQAPLSKVAAELELWERTAANLFMYVGLGEAKQVAADDVPAHAEELAKTWDRLGEQRAEILGKLGDAAAGVLTREATAVATASVDDADLRARAGELPQFTQDVDALGAQVPQIPIVGDAPPRPVTGEEFRQRQVQESKSLPEPATLTALLSASPPAWVQCAFETLGLSLPRSLTRDEEDDEVELTANSRTALERKVMVEKLDRTLLREVVYALEDPDRELLGELLAANGAMRYAEVTGKFGRDDADGFFWAERPPSGPLARLRRVGLAYVGMSGKRLVVQLPVDLQGPLREVLQAPPTDA